MVQKNTPQKEIFFTQRSTKKLDKQKKPIFLILIFIWISVLISMIIVTSVIDINDKFFIYFFKKFTLFLFLIFLADEFKYFFGISSFNSILKKYKTLKLSFSCLNYLPLHLHLHLLYLHLQ